MIHKCGYIKLVLLTGMQVHFKINVENWILCIKIEKAQSDLSFILVICNGPEKLSALLIPKENLIDAGFSFL